jgi:D-3-phosphoglycerate dehydrogenase / 2-oxoglutarate reductase
MAAETIRQYLEKGTIRHSVNFPATDLPEEPLKSIRITIVNKNIPGMLAHIMEAFANAHINILQQINHSRGGIAYNVMDFDPVTPDGAQVSLKELQKNVTMLDGVLSTRILFGTPGIGYARNVDGQYFV